jgi:hypothetical protein
MLHPFMQAPFIIRSTLALLSVMEKIQLSRWLDDSVMMLCTKLCLLGPRQHQVRHHLF